MWIANFSFPFVKESLISSLCKGFNVKIIGLPISGSKFKEYTEITYSGFIEGKEKDIRSLLTHIQDDERYINHEYENNRLILRVKQHYTNNNLLSTDLIYSKPCICDEEGIITVEVTSWTEESLKELINEYNKYWPIKINSFKKQNTPTIGHFAILPHLSKQQKKSLSLAIKHGYYDNPRQITLKKLAEIAGISYSTFQHHLQTVEKKIIPHIHSLL